MSAIDRLRKLYARYEYRDSSQYRAEGDAYRAQGNEAMADALYRAADVRLVQELANSLTGHEDERGRISEY